jgi:hypothetical protein
MVTEKEKMLAGDLYDASGHQLAAERRRARELCKFIRHINDQENNMGG